MELFQSGVEIVQKLRIPAQPLRIQKIYKDFGAIWHNMLSNNTNAGSIARPSRLEKALCKGGSIVAKIMNQGNL